MESQPEATGNPIFNQEGPQFAQRAYQHNAPFATKGSYKTQLSPDQESAFRQWVILNHVPTDPDNPTSDYDMRGYWLAMSQGKTEPWKGQGSHFPDTYKTPYDTTFSAESQYAKPGAPFVWEGDQLADTRNNSVVFREQPNLAALLKQITGGGNAQ